ncbi:MAG: hypothetical protein QCI38_02355 [Candidatus Thermoplasmatota archaeon]|nr:hypothetical protein [Candidatus Thermoplasmatota archaeon]
MISKKVLVVLAVLLLGATGMTCYFYQESFPQSSNGPHINKVKYEIVELESLISIELDAVNDFLIVDETIWIATDAGLYRYNISSDDLVNHGKQYPDDMERLFLLALDGTDLWIGTNLGVGIFDIVNETWKQIPGGGVPSMNAMHIIGDENYVWIATRYQGIMRYNKGNDTWTNYATSTGHLPDDEIFDIALEGDILWVAADSVSGYFDISAEEFFVWNETGSSWIAWDPSYLPAEYVLTTSCIFMDGNEIWFGSNWWGGPRIYNKSTGNWTGIIPGMFTENEDWKRMHHIVVDNNFAYFATYHGIKCYSRAQDNWQTFNETIGLLDDYVSATYIKGSDELWVGSDGGINLFRITTRIVEFVE